MLRHILGGTFVVLAAFGVGSLPADRPYLEEGVLRIARLLDNASLALESSSWHRRLRSAGMEPIADFPEGTILRQLGRSVGMLWIDITDRKGRTRTQQCTATLIATDLLITNHHCLETDGLGDRLAIELWTGYSGETPVRHKVEPIPVEVDAQLDFALLRLMPSVSGHRPEPLAQLRFRTAMPGERLFLLHHPKSKPLQVTHAHCAVAATNPADDHVLRHTCATLPGSSGALVFAEHDYAVVGLHRARRRNDDDIPGIATPVAALSAKSATLRRLAPAGPVQVTAR